MTTILFLGAALVDFAEAVGRIRGEVVAKLWRRSARPVYWKAPRQGPLSRRWIIRGKSLREIKSSSDGAPPSGDVEPASAPVDGSGAPASSSSGTPPFHPAGRRGG